MKKREKELFKLKGTYGILLIYEDRLIISGKSISGVLNRGGMNERVFYYNDLIGIDYNKPSLAGFGYFKMIIPGTITRKPPKHMLFASADDLNDDTTFVFKTSGKLADKINEFLIEKLRQKNSNIVKPVSTANTDPYDEIKKVKELLDMGIITQEEFEKKKKEILDL